MRFTVNMQAGDEIYVNTETGVKQILYYHDDGTIENGMAFLDPDSVFLRLQQGNNGLRATASDIIFLRVLIIDLS